MQPRHVIPGFAVSAWRHPYVPAALLTLAMLAACSPRAAEPLADEYLRFPEYVDPPAPRDTLAPVRDLIPWDTVPPRIAPEEAHVTAGVEILPHAPPVLHAGASVRDAQGRLASAGTLCLLWGSACTAPRTLAPCGPP